MQDRKRKARIKSDSSIITTTRSAPRAWQCPLGLSPQSRAGSRRRPTSCLSSRGFNRRGQRLIALVLWVAGLVSPVPLSLASEAAPSGGLKTHTVLVGNEPEGIAVDAVAGRAYIASSRSDMVTIIDTSTRMRL